MILFVWGGAAWFFYDGYIGYPKAAERYAEFDQLAKEMIAAGEAQAEIDESVRLAWAEKARANGWKIEKPKEITDRQIEEQKVIGLGLTIVGFGIVVWGIISMRQTITSDGKSIKSAFGKVVHYDEVKSLDKRKWDKKGIAYAHYTTEGKKQKITLDDYKFAGAEEIVEEIERRLGTAQPEDSPENSQN